MGSGEVEVNTWCLIARAVLIGGAVWETNWKITVEIVECKTVRDKDLLLTEFEVRTVSYGPSFFPFDLWPKREARGP